MGSQFKENHNHILKIYKTDEELSAMVTEVYGAALKRGEGAVLIATPGHRQSFEESLAAIGLDVTALRECRQLVVLDAAATLETFLVDGAPDAAKFHWAMGSVIDEMNKSYGMVNAYGEMVGILWDAGKPNETIRLEQLWNDLQTAKTFTLICGYAASQFKSGDLANLMKICEEHSQAVAPIVYCFDN